MSKRKAPVTNRSLGALAPSIDFPVTLCVLCYGENAGLARRFLSSLYAHTDPSLFNLRAGLNEVEPATRELFEDYAGRYGNVELFVEPRNVFKNPMMRRLFHEKPLTSGWTIWCDDDTRFTRSDWLQRLSLKIECSPRVAMWGRLFRLWQPEDRVRDWIEAASWYRGVDLVRSLDRDGREAVEFRFVTGGFWAIRTRVLLDLDWPDPRLTQANDDFLLGEALRQNGFEIGSSHGGVMINDAPRRNSDAPEVQVLGGGKTTPKQGTAPGTRSTQSKSRLRDAARSRLWSAEAERLRGDSAFE